MNNQSARENFRLRSFVRRSGRITKGQRDAREELWDKFGLSEEAGMLDMDIRFGRQAPLYLEIGFGTGQSLLAAAKQMPEYDFIGVETHKPGIGSLLLGVKLNNLSNLYVYEADVIDLLANCIPDASLDGVSIFFPDPWQKRKHNARRLIQLEFVAALAKKIKPNGVLHLATDWEEYAHHMMAVMTAAPDYKNLAGVEQYAERSEFRPITSKFEKRALREGRGIWDLQFVMMGKSE